MAVAQPSTFGQHLRSLFLKQDEVRASDEFLLEAYLNRRDEAAFEALLRRHGPMVLGVCRRILGNSHDAEDAFQATFFVLVRKAASIRPKSMVGNWLYGVASRISMEARRGAAKRRAKEAAVLPSVNAPEDERNELLGVLDRELQRLPAKSRSVIVLSDLEGKTRKEVALQLGWPEGTVASRLARARARLAKRLSRCGLAITGGSMGMLLSQNAASALVPASLALSTVKTSSLLAARHAAVGLIISAQVAALTEGALKTMLLNKVLRVIPILLIVAVIATGTGLVLWQAARADEKARAATPKDPPTSPANGQPPAVPPGKDAPRVVDVDKELERLKGIWVCSGYERDGKEHVDQQAKEAMWNETMYFHTGPDGLASVKGFWLHMSWERKNPGRSTGALAEFKLIPTTHGAIDLTWKSIPAPDFMPNGIDPAWEQATWNETKLDQAQPGLYSVEENRLRLCWGSLGGERPPRLKTKQGDKWTVHIYEKKAE